MKENNLLHEWLNSGRLSTKKTFFKKILMLLQRLRNIQLFARNENSDFKWSWARRLPKTTTAIWAWPASKAVISCHSFRVTLFNSQFDADCFSVVADEQFASSQCRIVPRF